MDRIDLERLCKKQLIELVLHLQWPDKMSRTSSKLRRRTRLKSARPRVLAGHGSHHRRLAENSDALYQPGYFLTLSGGGFPFPRISDPIPAR